jgi:hypothetical protein
VHNGKHAGNTIAKTALPEIQLFVEVTVFEEIVSSQLLILIARKVSLDDQLPGEPKGFQL